MGEPTTDEQAMAILRAVMAACDPAPIVVDHARFGAALRAAGWELVPISHNTGKAEPPPTFESAPANVTAGNFGRKE